jgi:hypothetical protein
MYFISLYRLIIEARLLVPTSQALTRLIRWIVVRLDLTLAAICFAFAAGYFIYLIFVSHSFFWDFQRDVAVVKAMAAGVSPYDRTYLTEHFSIFQTSPIPVTFVYPPLVAEAFYKLSWFMTTSIGCACLLFVQIVSWISIPYLLAGSPTKWYSREFLYVWGLYLVLFGFSGMRIFAVGNPAGILNALIIASIVVAVRTRDYKVFWVAILICSMVKIYFLAFLMLPVILDKRYIGATVFIFLFALAYSMNYFLSPVLFSEYLDKMAVLSQIPVVAEGWSLYSLAHVVFHSFPKISGNRALLLALGVHFLFVGIIILIAYAIAERYRRPYRFDLLCCWFFMSAFLISPRIFDYDIAVLTVPLVLLGRMLIFERGPGIFIAVSIAASGLMLIRMPLLDWISIVAIMGVWLGAAVQLLGTERVESPQANHHSQTAA